MTKTIRYGDSLEDPISNSNEGAKDKLIEWQERVQSWKRKRGIKLEIIENNK